MSAYGGVTGTFALQEGLPLFRPLNIDGAEEKVICPLVPVSHEDRLEKSSFASLS